MKEWKIRQKIFHQMMLGQDLGDDLGEDLDKSPIVYEPWREAIVKRALEYPTLQRAELYYPGKSYAVAITFAKLLEIHFGESMLSALQDPELLNGNDPYFKPYDQDPETYDLILKQFPWSLLTQPESGSSDFRKTVEYFELEFLLHDRTKKFIPS